MILDEQLGKFKSGDLILSKDYYNGASDTIIENLEPICPKCGEIPYRYTQCVCCVQKFVVEGEVDK